MELAKTIGNKLKDDLRGMYAEDQLRLITFIIYAFNQNLPILAYLYTDNTNSELIEKELDKLPKNIHPLSLLDTLTNKVENKVIQRVILVIDSILYDTSIKKSKEWIEFKVSLINRIDELRV